MLSSRGPAILKTGGKGDVQEHASEVVQDFVHQPSQLKMGMRKTGHTLPLSKVPRFQHMQRSASGAHPCLSAASSSNCTCKCAANAGMTQFTCASLCQPWCRMTYFSSACISGAITHAMSCIVICVSIWKERMHGLGYRYPCYSNPRISGEITYAMRCIVTYVALWKERMHGLGYRCPCCFSRPCISGKIIYAMRCIIT